MSVPGYGCIIAWSLVGSGLLLQSGCSSSTPTERAYPEIIDSQASVQSAPLAPTIYHTVKPGNTLYFIAWLYENDYRQIAAINNIADPNTIYPGQRIIIPPYYVSYDLQQKQPNSDPVAQPIDRNDQPPRRDQDADPSTTTKNTTPAAAKPSAANPNSNQQQPSSTHTGLQWTWPASGKVIAAYGSGNKGIDIAGESGQPIKATADGTVVYSGSGLIGYGKLIIVKHNKQFLSAYAHNQQVRVKEGHVVKNGQHIADMGRTGNTDRVMLHFELRKIGRPVNPEHYLPPR